MAITFSPESRRIEPPPDAPHYHVVRDTGGAAMLIEPPRFGTPAAARNSAVRCGYQVGRFSVMACRLPCRFPLPSRPRRRRTCRHCGKH